MNGTSETSLLGKFQKKIQTGINILSDEGICVFIFKFKKILIDSILRISDYDKWIRQNEKEKKKYKELQYKPLISVVVPVYNVSKKKLTECIESVINQSYDNFQLCLVDDGSIMGEVRKVLESYLDNPKIDIKYREGNSNICICTNIAIEMANGEFIAFMDCNDVLSDNALYEMAKKLNEDDYDFIYSDEDKIDDDGKRRYMPHFKQEWCPDTFMSYMYTSHFGMYRASIIREIGGLRAGYEGAQDYDFTLRFTEKTDKIGHIPKILYHCRESKESTEINPEAKTYILEATRKSKEDALNRRGIKGSLELIEEINQYRVKYDVINNPLVSVIIPTKDNFEIFKRCIESFLEKTDYNNLEFIVVDNGSSEENEAKYSEFCKSKEILYNYEKMEFNFSRMCNIGAKKANGEYYLLLNDDIEIIEPQWLKRMLGQAQLMHIGAVGAKLYYPNTKLIQHDGVIFLEPGPAHGLSGFNDDNIYYFGRNRLDYNYSAVTAACLLVSAEKYKEVGGFNESLAVTYNDVDFCLKLVEKGYYNVIRNDAILYHHESISRGNDLVNNKKMERLMREKRKLYVLHPQYEFSDSCYSLNLTQLTQDYGYNTEKIGIRMNDIRVTEREIKEKRKCKFDINYNLEINVGSKLIKISGWLFRENKKYENRQKTSIIFKGKNNYILNADRKYFGYLSSMSNDNGKYNLCAFMSFVEKSKLDKGKYDIYLKKGDLIIDSHQTIEI